MVTMKYFAWVRERIGKSEESLDIPEHVITVRDLLIWLKTLDEGYEYALQQPEIIRVALNHEHADHREKIAGVHEIALFPPMTGG